MNAYEVLGVGPDADEAAIRRAYRRAALRYHPDKNSAPEAAEMFQLLNDALAVLLDAVSRSELDAGITTSQDAAERVKRMSERTRQLRTQLEEQEQRAQASKRRRTAKTDIAALKLEGYERRRALDSLKSERPATLAMRTGVSPDGTITVFKNVKAARKAIDEFNCQGKGRWRLKGSWHPRAYSGAYEAATLSRLELFKSFKPNA